MAVKTCPTCQRKNGAHLLSCMFCRADLTAVSDVEELDIDALFQQTMLGDSALSSKKTFPKPVAASRPVSKPNPTPVRKRPAVVSNNDDELPLLDSDLLLELVDIPDSGIDPITDEFQPLFTLLTDLRALRERTQQREKLLEIATLARQIRRKMGREFKFEWGNHNFALVINPPNSSNQAEKLAKTLNINVVAARMYSAGETPRVVSRSETRFQLDELGEKYTAIFQRRSRCLSRSDILLMPPALTCVGINRRAFKVVDADLWLDPQCQEPPEEMLTNIWLVVIGDIEIHEYRWASGTAISSFGRRKTARAWKKQRESRQRVIDLHSQNEIIRIVEGVTDLSFLPGFVPDALKKSFNALQSFLPTWLPTAKIIPKHRVRVTDKDIPFTNEKGKEKMFVHAWKAWETHTRCCRLLFQDIKK